MHMSRSYLAAVATLGLAFTATNAGAGPMRLDATSTSPSTYSNFSVTFDDTGNGLLDFSEITGFSGVTLSGRQFQYLISVPGVAAVSDEGGGWPVNQWAFDVSARNSGTGIGPTAWTYTLTSLDTSGVTVPEPSTWALVGLALAGMALTQRRGNS